MLVLMCHAAGKRFAIDARHVVEVVPRVRLQTLARAPEWLAGVCIYRGQVTAVLDLSFLASATVCPNRWASRIIIVRWANGDTAVPFGLIVEQVAVAQLPPASERKGGSAPAGIALWGPVLVDSDGIFQLLEIPQLLTANQRAALDLHVTERAE